MKNVVHVGIILNGELIPCWIYQVVAKIAGSNYADLKLIVLNESARLEDNDPKASFFFKLHRKLDRQVFGKRYNFNQLVDATALFQGIARCSLSPKNENAWSEIASYKLDVLLNLSAVDFSTCQFPLARFGVWQYVIGERNCNSLAYIYGQMINEGPVMEISVRATNGEFEREAVIHRSWVPVNYHSIQINQYHLYSFCSLILPRLLAGIYKFGTAYFGGQTLHFRMTLSEQTSAIFFSPSNYQAVVNVFKMLSRYLSCLIAHQTSGIWFLMLKVDSEIFPILPNDYKALIPPKDRAWADPFVLSRDGNIFIFVEEFLYRDGKGYISLLEIGKEGDLFSFEKILERPFHISYPFIFELNAKWYMIPETSANKTIELYECVEFPRKWSFVMNLKEDINAVDSTIFFNNNRWWLFTAVSELSTWSDYKELHLFSSDTLFTDKWEPHPLNPIVTDVRTARPAGRIFMKHGQIYRPSQDCSFRYGRAFNLNQITTLSENAYAETMLSKIEAGWDADVKGTHTFNCDKKIAVIDAYRYRKRFANRLF
ncbi:glucosamine inositolphosphorylceramide transferase family protein [Gaoshiqia sediminis]|uniref:Glucosamine inositolphosphorylceramide transferase 1 N-terminal domain-containing protein n=1 Tax=Gaoshiqia sediminis TaxID=2986998 RepID=A0AA42C951_9BACT|nr:hypothetical protein [Gaoshiqia sediminis]MCW0481670.1 hypothetical protein [Gaoshiqia sediminis]